MMKMKLAVWMVAAGLSLSWVAADDAVLVRAGRINAVVIVTEQLMGVDGPHAVYPASGRVEEVRFIDRAVDEIKEHLGLLGEGDVEILRMPAAKASARAAEQAGAGRAAIVLGGPELDRALYKSIGELGDDPESFALRVEDATATVLGPTPKGVLNGVYELLEQVGFRWYLPENFGRVVPPGDTHVLRAQKVVQVPSFSGRYRLWQHHQLPHNSPWAYRMRHTDIGRVGAGHGARGVTRKLREEHPEIRAMIDGERKGGQICVSSPVLLDILVEHNRAQFNENPENRVLVISPGDGYGFCECEGCTALDAPGVMASLQCPIPSMTDRYIWINNQVIDRLADEFPDIKVPLLIYAGIMDPPVRYKPDPRAEWFGSIADIHVCRIHGPGNPACPENRYAIWLTKQWAGLGVKLGSGAYHWNLACPGFPFMMISRIRDEVPIFHELGMYSVSRVGALGEVRWGNHGPAYYLAAKLAWDVKTDVDALLAGFFDKFYGPAAGPMEEYTMLMDNALYTADYHTGSGWDLVHIYDEPVRKQARSALKRAERRVGLRPGLMGRLVSADRVTGANALYAMRVEVAAKGWAFFDAFADMMESRRRHDFAASMAALERAHAIADSLVEDYEYPMLQPFPSIGCKRYLDVFFGHATEAGYECLSDGGELIAGLDSKWEFMIEPQGIGERIGLHDPFYTGGNWRTIDTRHSWSTQGLRYYYGEAWYRQRVKIPADAAGKKIHLWFSGVDRGARVWVNGQMLGTSPGAEFDIDAFGGITRPFEFDATTVVLPGRENVVTVRAIRDRCNELGTGGLRDVAMFYAPGEE